MSDTKEMTENELWDNVRKLSIEDRLLFMENVIRKESESNHNSHMEILRVIKRIVESLEKKI